MAVVEFQLSRKMIDWIADSQGLSLEALAGDAANLLI